VGIKLGNETHKFEYEEIARILKCPVPDHGKSLARWTSEHAIDLPRADPGRHPDVRCLETHN
jgi:hypothetical protein